MQRGSKKSFIEKTENLFGSLAQFYKWSLLGNGFSSTLHVARKMFTLESYSFAAPPVCVCMCVCVCACVSVHR